MTTKAIWAEGLSSNGWIMGPGLPWGRIAGDLAHFRAATKDHVLVMGRRTFEDLPASMKTPEATAARPLVILTTGDPFAVGDTLDREGYWWVGHCTTPDEVLRIARICFPAKERRVAVIGGPKVIEFMEPVLDTLLVSTIRGHHHGDVPAPEESFLKEFPRSGILGIYDWGSIWQYDREVPNTDNEGDTQ